MPNKSDYIRNVDGMGPASFTRREALGLVLGAVGVALVSHPKLALADTASDLAAAQAQYDALQSQLDQIGKEYETLSQQQSQTMTKIEQTQAQIDQTQAQIDQKQKDLDKKQEVLSKRISSNYKSGASGMLALLLSSTSFDDFVSNVYYMDKISESDRQMIDDIKAAKEELDDQKASLENDKQQLEDLNTQQTQQLDDMRAKQEQTQTLLDSASQSVKDLMAQRDAEILAVAQAAAAARAAQVSSSTSTGTVSLPAVGGGEDYNNASSAQKSIVNACYSVPSPGAGYCAAWVSQVYSAAGQGYYGGDACDMYSAYCTSSNKSDLKVGMIVAVSSHSHTSAGRIYGHIGIYVGSGTMMDNIGYIRTIGVDEWISFYGTTVTPRWGWLGGTSLA